MCHCGTSQFAKVRNSVVSQFSLLFSSLRLALRLPLEKRVTAPGYSTSNSETRGRCYGIELRIWALQAITLRGQMLKILRSPKGQEVVFVLSGQIDGEHIAELQTLISSEASGQRIALDLRDLTLAGQDAVSFLALCEAEGITLKNCPAYVREWITGQRHGS